MAQAKIALLKEDGSEDRAMSGKLMTFVHIKRTMLKVDSAMVKLRSGKMSDLATMSEAPEVSEDGTLRLVFNDGSRFRVEIANAMDMERFLGELRKAYTDRLMKKEEKPTPKISEATAMVKAAVSGPAPRLRRSDSFDDFGSTSQNRLPNTAKKVEVADSRDTKRKAIDAKVLTSPEKFARYGPVSSNTIKIREPVARSTVLQRRPSNPPQDSSRYGGYRSSHSFGLQNLGNTCYLNAVTQAMRSLHGFVRDLQNMPTRLSTCQDGELFKRTVEILKQMGETESPLSPAKLREQIGLAAPMFRGSGQQDAHEFFLEYVNQLHDELLLARKTQVSDDHMQDEVDLATQFFDSEVQKQLVCMQCQNTRSVSEHFRDFSLDFNGEEGDTRTSVEGMLSSYFKTETVEARCEQCDCGFAHLEKHLAVPPQVLVLHLKRFIPNIEKQCYEKRHQNVDIPPRLDLAAVLGITAPMGLSPARLPARPLAASSPITVDSPNGASMTRSPSPQAAGESSSYDLQAIVTHEGTTPRSGHYVCYAKSNSGIWRLYDDSRVTELPRGEEPQKKLGQKAYLVFYVLNSS